MIAGLVKGKDNVTDVFNIAPRREDVWREVMAFSSMNS